MAQFVGGLLGNLLNRAKTLPQQFAAIPQLVAQAQQPRASYAESQPVFKTPPGYSAPGYIGGKPAGQVIRSQQVSGTQASTTNTSGGGTQAQQVPQSNPTPQPQPSYNPPQEYFEPQPVYVEPEVDISQDLRLAEETVNQGIADYEASLAGVDTRTAQGKADLEAQKQYQATETGRIKGEVTSSTESAVNESRQAAAELQQGLAARYGASSSTGLGASAILGQQAMRSISEARVKLSQTVGFLDQKQKDLEYQTFRAEQIVNSKADELKAQARQELQQAQLAAQNLRAGASRFKQSLVSEAIQRYRDTVNQINARNTAFKQTLYLKQQEQQAEIDRIRENAKTKSTEMADANSKYVTDLYKSMAEKGQLSTQGFNQFEEKVGVPTGTFIPKKEDEDPFDALRNLKKIGAGNV